MKIFKPTDKELWLMFKKHRLSIQGIFYDLSHKWCGSYRLPYINLGEWVVQCMPGNFVYDNLEKKLNICIAPPDDWRNSLTERPKE